MTKRNTRQLKEKAEPIVQPSLKGTDLKAFFQKLVIIARNNAPNRAKDLAYSLCLEQGLNWKSAKHFSDACRHLAILRKFYFGEFLSLFKEDLTLMQKISAHEHERRES